jgi:hypothetical protein
VLELLNGEEAGSQQEWLEHVYTDEPLVTQLDGSTWLSSSSQPSLMAMILEALAVSTGSGTKTRLGPAGTSHGP